MQNAWKALYEMDLRWICILHFAFGTALRDPALTQMSHISLPPAIAVTKDPIFR
ncbi:MAG: hypothetical protein AAFY20_23300 [Cyanobacteria bacterium J06639_14]